MKKTISIILLLILVLIALSGCVKVDYSTKINEDGSAEIKYIYSINKTVIENLEDNGSALVSDMREKAVNVGFATQDYEDEETLGFSASKNVEDITKEPLLLEIFGEKYIKNGEESKIKIEKYLFGKKFSQTAEVDLTELKDLKKLGGSIKYRITLPTKVGKTNAATISQDRKTLTWDLTFGEVQEINFKAKTRNSLYMDNDSSMFNHNSCNSIYFNIY